jgi:hypothetical protein
MSLLMPYADAGNLSMNIWLTMLAHLPTKGSWYEVPMTSRPHGTRMCGYTGRNGYPPVPPSLQRSSPSASIWSTSSSAFSGSWNGLQGQMQQQQQAYWAVMSNAQPTAGKPQPQQSAHRP